MKYKFLFPLFLAMLLLSGCANDATPDMNAGEAKPTPIIETATKISNDTPEPTTTPAEAEMDTNPNKANADVLFVKLSKSPDGSWTFAVTVFHPDSGWDDYADGWDVVLQDGTVLKPDSDSPFTRLLLHPHVDEQPFTRSQSGILIPAGATMLTVRAHDLVDGFGGSEVTIDLNVPEGKDYRIE